LHIDPMERRVKSKRLLAAGDRHVKAIII